MKKYLLSISAFFVWMSLLITVPALAALSEQEKAQKREELDRYFSAALAKTQAKAEAYQVFRLTAHGSTRLGHDSNLDLDRNEDGDMFHEQKAGVDAVYAPENWELAGHPLAAGLRGRYGYRGYFDRSDMDRQIASASPYLRLELGEDLRLETGYDFRARIYDTRQELNYLSHGSRTLLTHRLTPNLTHHFKFVFESHEYFSERRAILHNGLAGDDHRRDERYEVSYGGRYKADRWTFSLEGIWLWNDSNDDFVDFNDYQDGGLDAAVSYRALDRLILTGFGGYHRREYVNRAPVPSFSPVQEDDWYYLGGRLFYSINIWSGVDVTFTYYDNDSNDPNHQYDGTLTSVAYHLYF